MFIAVQEEHTMPHRHVKAPGLAFNMVAKTNLSSDKTTYGCVCVSHVYKLGYGNSIVLNYAFFVSYKLYIYIGLSLPAKAPKNRKAVIQT